jgi:hypothetical protein
MTFTAYPPIVTVVNNMTQYMSCPGVEKEVEMYSVGKTVICNTIGNIISKLDITIARVGERKEKTIYFIRLLTLICYLVQHVQLNESTGDKTKKHKTNI